MRRRRIINTVIVAFVVVVPACVVRLWSAYERAHPCLRYEYRFTPSWVQLIDTGNGTMVPIVHEDSWDKVCVVRQ
jgi:hypothetical protein